MLPGLPQPTPHGDERETLVSFLEHYRAVFRRKMHGLDTDQLAVSLPPSTLTLGGLWFHMAFVEDIWFHQRIDGEPSPEPWASAPWDDDPDWEINTAHTRTPEELRSTFEAAVARSDTVLARSVDLSRSTTTTSRDGNTRSLRWVLVHMIEEYARHCGHADLLRQSIDGRTGD